MFGTYIFQVDTLGLDRQTDRQADGQGSHIFLLRYGTLKMGRYISDKG